MGKFYSHQDTSWNNAADWYHHLVGEKGSDYHRHVILPGALKLLAPQKNENILDIGCGQGVFCRKLSPLCATVTGIDAADQLIKLAKKQSAPFNNVKYFTTAADQLAIFPDKHFDAAACIMSIQNMDPLQPVIREAERVLKTGGRLLLVMSHPCFRIPRQSGWGFDEKRKLQYRRIDSYMSEQRIPIQMQPGYNPKLTTWTFHRPLSAYFKVLKQFHFYVMELEEWTSHRQSLPGKSQKAENRSREEIPLFLAILAKKVQF